MSDTNNEQSQKEQNQKKKNPFVAFFKTILFILIGIIFVIALWCTFCAFNKQSALSMLPSNYTAYLHTDSLYESVNPLLDLQAADIFLADDSMSDIRGVFMMFRESKLRTNKYVKFFLSRKVDVALFLQDESSTTIVASIDFGIFSSITRFANFVVPFLKVKGLSRIQQDGIDFIQFRNGQNIFYIKPVKNLVIASNDYNYFLHSLNANNDSIYTQEQKELLTKKTQNPIKLVVDSKNIATTFINENPLLQKNISYIKELLSDNTLSILSLGISDNEISINFELPLELKNLSSDKTFSKLTTILNKDSTIPDIVSIMSSSIQYYTVLNAATLEQLINGVLPLTMSQKDFSDNIKSANNLSNALFNMPLDELLYSWTDKEFAMLGIEGLNDPVFAIKISDEQQRKKVMDKMLDSILLTENKSLILNGVRIPRIQIPNFLQNIIKLFGVELPKPYYLVYNNYIYFSESAETISAIYSSFAKGKNISHNPNWKEVSSNTANPSSISLFYDLEKTIPFFIKSKSELSKILSLYTIGRADISIKNGVIKFNLKAISKRAGMLKTIPGFPIKANVASNFEVYSCNVEKPQTIFWLENNQHIKALNVKQTKIYEYELPDSVQINTVTNGNDEFLFALTEQNKLYKFNNKLEVEKGFPVSLSNELINEPYFDVPYCYIPTASGKILKVKNSTITFLDFKVANFEDFNLTTFYNGQAGVMYKKSFDGEIYVLVNEKCINATDPIIIDKIGFERPAISKLKDNAFYIGFIAQTGNVSLWKVDGDFINAQHQIKLDGQFLHNFIASGDYFFALSTNAEIFRINYSTGEVLSVQLDNIKAKEGKLELRQIAKKNLICAAVDGNLIYAFNENLELVSGFPVPGFGIPGFADVNGDSNSECFALTLDNKLNAWNLR